MSDGGNECASAEPEVPHQHSTARLSSFGAGLASSSCTITSRSELSSVIASIAYLWSISVAQKRGKNGERWPLHARGFLFVCFLEAIVLRRGKEKMPRSSFTCGKEKGKLKARLLPLMLFRD